MGNRQAVNKHGRRSLAVIGATVVFVGAVATSVPAGASNPDPLNEPPSGSGPLGGLLPKDAPGTAAGLTPRLAALAGGLADEPKAKAAEDLSLRPSGAGSLERDGHRYIVTARADLVTPQLLDGLRAAGAEIVSNNAEYGTVDLSVLPQDLVAVARVPGVKSVYEDLQPEVGRVDGALNGPTIPGRAASQTNVNTCQGSRTSEGDIQMNAAAARQTFNVDGFGQKVGIISDSFDSGQASSLRAAQDIASGDLPGPGNPCGHTDPVQVIAEGAPGDEDEGRGMAQIVHDIAPGADIAFAGRGSSPDTMASQILALKNAGSSVITDDITFFSEPFFQEGPIDTAIDQVVAAGVPYYSSAANSNVIVGGQNVGSYETDHFRPMSCTPFAGTNCMDFSGGGDNNYGLVLNGGSQMQVNFQWAEPRNGVTTDLDIFAYDNTLGSFVAQGDEDNLQTQLPFELMNVQNTDSAAHTYFFFILRAQGTSAPRLKFILGRPRLSAAEYTTSGGPNIIGPTIFGHNGGPNVVSTAAIPYDNAAAPETFSSRGPVAYYFGPVSGTTPAQPIAPQVLNKPDLAATDNTQTTFFGNQDASGIFRFAGTSAAAPHAAAVAALQKSANPFLTVPDVVGAQEATASAVGGFGHTDVGAGLINAVGAIGAHPPLVPETTITEAPKKHVFSKSVTYQFESNLPGSQFVCQIDNSKAVLCSSPVRVNHIPYGRHRFFVSALFNNQLDQTPATDQFKRKHRLGRHH
jgi:hypothetical protein